MLIFRGLVVFPGDHLDLAANIFVHQYLAAGSQKFFSLVRVLGKLGHVNTEDGERVGWSLVLERKLNCYEVRNVILRRPVFPL